MHALNAATIKHFYFVWFITNRMEPDVSADESSIELPDLNDSNVDLVEFVMKRRRRRICDGPLFPPIAQPFSPIDIKFLKKKVPPSMENIPPPTSHEAACASVPSTTKTLPLNVAQGNNYLLVFFF